MDYIVRRGLLDKVLGNSHGQMGNGQAETVEYTSRRIEQVLLDRNFLLLFRLLLFVITRGLVRPSACKVLPSIGGRLVVSSKIVQIELGHIDIVALALVHVDRGVEIKPALVGARRQFYFLNAFVILHILLNLPFILEHQALATSRWGFKVAFQFRSHFIIYL